MNPIQTKKDLGALDLILVVIFLFGIYTGFALRISATIPFPAALSGLAGMVLLWRRRANITPTHLATLLIVLLVFVGSILSATNFTFLAKRLTGLIQLTYSFVICYALYLTVLEARAKQMAAVLLGFCVFILLGCVAETYLGLRGISDWVRLRIFDHSIVYDSDLRDQLLYGRIRPKLFTSEPSAVTFAYVLYSFLWLLLSTWRHKMMIYIFVLFSAGLMVMPGPTLILMLALIVPYQLLERGNMAALGNRSPVKQIRVIILSTVFLIACVLVGATVYAKRIEEIISGQDASFFYREIGPALTAFDVFKRFPLAGVGLTGEPFISRDIVTIFMQSTSFSNAWQINSASEVLTNYFWLHWIYLGLGWGIAAVLAIDLWLRGLGVKNRVACWTVWIILGQASGAYVSPKTWAVMLLTSAALVLHTNSQTARNRKLRVAPNGAVGQPKAALANPKFRPAYPLAAVPIRPAFQ